MFSLYVCYNNISGKIIHKYGKVFGPDSFTNMDARVGIEPTSKSFADFRLTTWLRRQKAEDEIRTRDLHLGKVELYH